ncbi:CKLF-like MARVEL transmembrane domain-containing protein 7 isoform X1 [Takifugu flavidus]|uniref:CKLF-like MARVEL transmembrane domain-containing protein 7 isoform X1 n=1 Tax=Takifugu flavidus TaxID=433684 RepID=UPI002544681E|nr:CKLF-like MARVEL transmembrane domain-containing protein 7 isoform X1 [Takifugu flavidus]
MPHAVVTTTTTSSRTPADGTMDVGYARTIPGLLKLGQIVALLTVVLCVHCAHGWPNWAAFQFFEVVAMWFLGVFLIFFLMHLFKLHAKMSCINWPLTEFFHYTVGAILVFIASIVAATKSRDVSALVTASVFGFIATFLMGVSLWTSYSVTCGSPHAGATV